jgi:hypothetical protein
MPAHVSDLATLSEAAYEAADETLSHTAGCAPCTIETCRHGMKLWSEYEDAKNAALKAIRGPKTRGKRRG